MTIEEYIKGLVNYSFSDAQLAAILAKRGIPTGTDISVLSARLLDLSYADALVILITTASGGSIKDSMGDWSHEEGSKNYNYASLLSIVNSIYDKYNLRALKDRTKTW